MITSGIFSQQSSSNVPLLPKGYVIVRRANQLQKTYDMVNFTTLANSTTTFSNPKYNESNNSVYYTNNNNTLIRLNLTNNVLSGIYGSMANNATFQLNLNNQSIIGRTINTNEIVRVNLSNHSTSTYTWTTSTYGNAVVNGTTNTTYIRNVSSGPNTGGLDNSSDGITWTNRWSSSSTGASSSLTAINYLLSLNYRQPSTGNPNYEVSNDGGTTRTVLSTTVNYNNIIIFDENEYMVCGSNSRIPITSTDSSTWNSYTFPQTGTYTINNGAKSSDGIYLVVGTGGMIFRNTTGFTSASGWSTITNPFGDSTNITKCYYTDRFIITSGTSSGVNANTIATSFDGLSWTILSPSLNQRGDTMSCFIPEI